MAKKQTETKPLFPLKHEFYDSLDRFAHESFMLAEAVRTAIQLDGVNEKVKPILQERLDAFMRVWGGNE